MFEVQEKANAEASDLEVADHLGDVSVVECIDDFGIYDDGMIDDQIWDEVSDGAFFVEDSMHFLLLKKGTKISKLDAQGILVKFFIQTVPEFTMNFHRRTNDALCKFSM